MIPRRLVGIALFLAGASSALLPPLAIGRDAASSGSTQVVSCSASHLHLGYGPFVSAKTQELPVVFVLSNRSATPCKLDGYPRIAMYGLRGKPLPFIYRRRGDLELAASKPKSFTLAPGHRAYFAINQRSCVLHTNAVAKRVGVNAPNTKPTHTMNLQTDWFVALCSPTDPAGRAIDVTPIEATTSNLFAT
jgi:hypothetical protein